MREPLLTPPAVPSPASAAAPTRPYAQAPVLEMNHSLVVLLVNLFFPGIGTIVAGVLGGMKLIGRGIAQLILSLIIVGWIWALVTSIQCLSNSTAAGKRF